MTSPDSPHDDHLDSLLTRQLHRSRRYAWVFVAGLAVLVLALTGAVIYLIMVNSHEAADNKAQIESAQAASDHRWCTVLQLITTVPQQKPANPSSNPSRAITYEYYTDFLTLRHEFHC